MARFAAQRLIDELGAAALQPDAVALEDRQALLLRAAASVRHLRDTIAFSEPELHSPNDIIPRLQSLAANVDDYPAGLVAAAMMDAVDVLKALLVLLDAKYEVILEDAEPEGRA